MMSAIIQLVQCSPEWHAHRQQHRNASETAIVMGQSPWVTPYQLWEIRTGRKVQTVNAAMARGTALEPAARLAYEALTGHVMQPLVLVDGDYSASLDGLTFDGQLLVEIKCPVKGKTSSLWQQVSLGEIPIHYQWQLEHQFMVSKAQLGHLYVFDGKDGLLLEVKPNPERWQAIHEAWNSFMHCIDTDTPPTLTERDQITRTDSEWRSKAESYLEAKRQAEAATAALEAAKSELLLLSTHPSESGYGVSVSRFWKKGAVDYKRVPELAGVDLEQYRKKGGVEVRITTGN